MINEKLIEKRTIRCFTKECEVCGTTNIDDFKPEVNYLCRKHANEKYKIRRKISDKYPKSLTQNERLIRKEKRLENSKSIHKEFKIGSSERNRSKWLWRAYRMTLEEYDNLLKEFGNSCGICKEHQSNLSLPLHIDHDHVSNKVRGLLCRDCNFGIGLFKDNISIIQSAISYLELSKKQDVLQILREIKTFN